VTGEPAASDAAADQEALDRVLDGIGPLDTTAMARAADRLDRLTKPPGSLGQLETVVIELAGITGRADPSVEHGVVVVAAGDHGVTRLGVSAYPSDVTAQMVANFVAGGAAINVLGAWAGLRVVVVDAGVASPIPTLGADPHRGGRLVQARIRDGTADMTLGPAMTRAEALRRRSDSTIHLEIRKAYLDLKAAAQRVEVASAAAAEAEEAHRIIQNRHQAGLITVTELLRSETALAAARTRRLAAVYDQRVAAAVLDHAAGTLAADSARLN